MTNPSKYANWTREDLIARVLDLENSILPGEGTGSRTSTTQSPPPPLSHPQPSSQWSQPTSSFLRGAPVTRISPEKSSSLRQSVKSKAKIKDKGPLERKLFDFSLHPRRKVALRFTYAGWEYGGLAYQAGLTPLPTVEGVLFDALVRTRLIDETKGFEGCEWERCGRTDRGVSGAGNVVSLWVRSAIPHNSPTHEENTNGHSSSSDVQNAPPTLAPSDAKKELRYVSMLNRVLPPTIRVVAWSAVTPTFSSRFACKYRHYKYFFNSRNLDISRMQDAASRLLGEHDFRNLCKLDASKQITNFRRTILQASLSPARLEGRADLDGIWAFDLKGTAFLYNQVRHIMAVLFLVGAGLEHPSLMTALLNVDKKRPYPSFKEGEPIPPVVDRKPEYQIADGLPLVLWDCAYSDEEVEWQIDEGEGEDGGTTGAGGVFGQLKSIHERSMIHTALDAYFLESASKHHPAPMNPFPLARNSSGSGGVMPHGSGILQIPLGGGTHQRTCRYVPVLSRKRLEDVFVVNERWKRGKGARKGPPV